jgi:aminobenzoyl-glutamate utilization protein A
VSGREDCSVLMSRVQERGGSATYVAIGSDLPSGHHTRTFDIDESVLARGVEALSLALIRFGEDAEALTREEPVSLQAVRIRT